MSEDRLLVQIAWIIKKRPGHRIPKETMYKLTELLIEHKPLPKTVDMKGIFWKNPDRKGEAGEWRYHTGTDLEYAPGATESRPRVSLREAIDSLSRWYEEGLVTF